MLPSHIDPTINLHDYYYAHRGGVIEEIWRVDARGKVQPASWPGKVVCETWQTQVGSGGLCLSLSLCLSVKKWPSTGKRRLRHSTSRICGSRVRTQDAT
ncbi:hypothetical protein VTK73DRAFT_4488 [Phialemonium thermophilum]|uniref:Uncharacterized protein n=1 Tax=Phialemonium thermophilum TaxID=223376 RepID=A0ABR3V8D3_9PEZI